ncbi:hypothetical protein [Arthrobacter sp. Bz4]|uniref:hypothetical protein n=1 Tax=Arthrobacter sp. Bz4 TaxID=2171979 RepID=UPI0014035ABC|nr:hypothetical protein [Arthrobacter sp. Bz4]
MHFLPDLRLRQNAIGRNINEPALLGLNFFELIPVLRVHLLYVLLFTDKGFIQSGANVLLEGIVQHKPTVGFGHTVLDEIGR